METKIDKTSDTNLTEEVTRPHHAPYYYKAPTPSDFYEFFKHTHLCDNTSYGWTQAYKYATGMTTPFRDQYVDYALEHFHHRFKKEDEALRKHKAQEKHAELGPREFTLTYAPEWYESDEDAQNAMRCAIERLTRYYSMEIIEFHAVGEFTTAGRSHVHGWYNLAGGRKITDKNFKRAWKHWNPKRKLGRGFEGGHHETIQRLSDFSAYTEKHLEEAWLNLHITNDNPEVISLPQDPPSPSQADASQTQDAHYA